MTIPAKAFLAATLTITAILAVGIHDACRRRRALQARSAREVASWMDRLARHPETR